MENQQSANSNETKASFKIKALFLVIVLSFIAVVAYGSFTQSSDQEGLDIDADKNNQEDKQVEQEKASDRELDFTAEDMDGNQFALSSFKGQKPVMIIFWATWCGFCAKELEYLEGFVKEHSQEIEVVLIPGGEVKTTIEEYISAVDTKIRILLDERREIWNQYLIRGTPSHFVIGKNGELITALPGLATLDNLETMFSMLAN